MKKVRQEGAEFDRVEAPSLIPYYSAGILWIVYALLFPLYRFWHFLIPVLLSAFLFLLTKKFCKPRYITVRVPQKEPTEDEKWQQGAEDYLRRLREADMSIEDEAVSSKIRRVELLSEEIFEIVAQKPEKRPQVRRFMSYYLPTLLKLLHSYDEMETVDHGGKNINSSREKISGLLDTAVAAFTKLSDELYAAESLDISSDITVFKTLLKQEGLSDTNDSEVK